VSGAIVWDEISGIGDGLSVDVIFHGVNVLDRKRNCPGFVSDSLADPTSNSYDFCHSSRTTNGFRLAIA